MLFLTRNYELVKDREKTYLTASVAVAGTTLTVKGIDANALADNDWLIVGEIGTKNCEILQVNGAVSDGTSITIDNAGSGGARYAHSINEPVYRTDFNQIEFSRATTITGSKSVLATNELQVDDEYTRYDDTTNSTGYGFVRFKNSTTTTYSAYSSVYPYAGDSAKSLSRILKSVRRLLSQNGLQEIKRLNDDDIIEEVNEKQRDIAHERLWSFYEDIFSDKTVAHKQNYTINSSVAIGKVHTVICKSEPLAKMDTHAFELLHWDTATTGEPTSFSVWNNEIRIYPLLTNCSANTALNDATNISATDTTITVDSTDGFASAGTIIIDDETITYTSKTSTTFVDCTRGADSTTAAIHLDDAVIINGVSNTKLNDADDITATDTIIVVDDTSSFSQSGRLIIDSEVIGYTYKDSTTFYGCTRGLEATTAATHSDGVLVTERDIIYTAHKEPIELSNMSDETAIPDPMVLVYGAGMELALSTLQDQVLHDRLKLKYDEALKRLREKFGRKATMSYYRIKDKSEVVTNNNRLVNPNSYPSNFS